MSDAFGGVQKLAGKAKLNAHTLYRTLSREATGTEKLAGCFTSNGNAAHSPSVAQTRCLNHACGCPSLTSTITPRFATPYIYAGPHVEDPVIAEAIVDWLIHPSQKITLKGEQSYRKRLAEKKSGLKTQGGLV
jgi:hypothetical protein